jgi:RNA binding exosome subunit
MDKIKINVVNIVGSTFCVDTDDGEKIFAAVHNALKENKKVLISFQNVEMLTSAFLNTAIGQLYRGDFSDEFIKNSLSIEDLELEDKALLKRVVETAKLYYKDPERMQKSIQEIMGED